jgi:hypothetical protein
MRLLSQKVLVLALALATGCHETTAPVSGFEIGVYVLNSINDQPLPAIKFASPGDTIRVVRSTVTLTTAGRAEFSDSLSTVHLTSPPIESISTYTLDFRISGTSITFVCEAPVDCATLPVGIVSSSTLTLTGGLDPEAVLLYRRTRGP